jgi:hypothetical protein
MITSRDNLLTYADVAQRLSLSLDSRESLDSCVLRMEQGTQNHCTTIVKP